MPKHQPNTRELKKPLKADKSWDKLLLDSISRPWARFFPGSPSHPHHLHDYSYEGSCCPQIRVRRSWGGLLWAADAWF